MKPLLILLSIFTVSLPALSQSESTKNRAVADSFESRYNAGNLAAIFASFSKEMQAALPEDKTREFLSGLKTEAGNITSREFERYEESYASYKTVFEKALYTVNISADGDGRINGLFVKPYVPDNLPKITRNSTPLQLPFKGEWTVTWGGDTKALNYHVESRAQKNAFDLVMTNAGGKSFKTDGKTNVDYYAFGQELYAPCAAEVVLVVDGVKDNIPGRLNPFYVPGNTVILKTANNEFLFFAHFKQHSIVVRQGQNIRQGQLLGLCGNSGNSSEPHLHFHIQNVEEMTEATGVKCHFEQLMVNGQLKTDYSPIKGEKIKPAS